MSHTTTCINVRLDTERRQHDHAIRRPDACKRCHGAGGAAYPGTLEIPPDWEDCDGCLAGGRCPGCGKHDDVFVEWANGDYAGASYDLTCPHCGWTFADGEEPTFECVCWADKEPT